MKIKKILMMVILSSIFSLTMAQSITVTYIEQMKTSASVSAIEDPQIKAAVEAKLREMNRDVILQSHGGKSIYKPVNDNGNASSVYKDVSSNKLIMQDVIIDKQFLITDQLPKLEWVIGKEQKEILGKKCTRATTPDGEIVAWFCSEMAISDGPREFWGCPGLILELETKAMIITAKNIELSKTPITTINPPTSGKVISKKEFAELKAQKAKELGAFPGGGGVQIIKM